MKKIIIPFDGAHFSKGAFQLATTLNETKPILLTGIFLPQVDYANIFFFPTSFAAPAYVPMVEESEEEIIEKNVAFFTSLCEQNNIRFRVHKDLFDSAISQLSKESRFADLMIIGSEVFYTSGSAGPYEYLKDALHHAKCPVIVVPEKFNYPSQVILAYDGSDSSLFAIKQFAYLFPELCKLHTLLIYFGDDQKIPSQELVEEFASVHFEKLSIKKLPGQEKQNFEEFVSEKWNPLIVSGSFNRSGISEMFKKSFIIETIKQHKCPVFIAHQ